MISATSTTPRFLWPLFLLGAALTCCPNAHGKELAEEKLERTGFVMGLDPGLAWRINDLGTPLYARMNLRIGGCFNERVQLGADLRMDVYVSGLEHTGPNRREIGPVATFFLVRGWFLSSSAHFGTYDPFIVAMGLSTGYEWGLGRFTAAGLSVGSDMDVLFNDAPAGYSFFFSLYLTAYDLASRHDRE